MSVQRLGTLLLALLVNGSSGVLADSPPSLPATNEIRSPNQTIMVTSSLDKGTQIVDSVSKQELRSRPDWFRSLFVSNDGDYLVTGSEGMNLSPLDYTDDRISLTFWKRGSTLRTVTLKETIPDPSILICTGFHYQWGHIGGINEHGELVVDRADAEVLYFDLSPGWRK
ncbi:MAG: hypothetical protein OEZ57_00155 [Nitrospirota bacterium]|nr:hypothetical protein [Nitrospirota bacterium]MDH5586130.1 hypothetical protein [Nitrospirota bacterium]MDH5773311.1 hypothetical protein [Nitrospirota bacterium]